MSWSPISHRPILSLAVDALNDLEGADAVTGLWTVFTKCKESLQDGPRLEYISWRLWYRQLEARRNNKPSPPSPHLIPVSCPLTPVSELGVEHPGSCPASPESRKPELGPRPNGTTKIPPSFSSITPPPVCRLVTTRPKPNSSVGKIIRDMILDKFDLATVKPPARPSLPKLDPIIVAADPGAMVVAPIPSMRLPPTSTPSGGLFPRVVVVNPTPHPTPPATPVPAGPPTSLPTTGHHLAPPPRLSAAVARHHSPDATTPSDPVTTPACPPPHLLPSVPIATASPPQLNSPLDPHPHPSQLSHPHRSLHLQSQAPRLVDDTLKPSDRRFFLQQDQSPSPERDGPDRGSNGSISTGRSPSETGELQPSSVTSNQTRASAASGSSQPTGRGRRSKNPPFRPALTRLNSGRHVVQVMRKDLTRVRPPPQHNVDKAPKAAGPSRLPRSPLEPHPPTKGQTNGATAPQAPNVHATPSAAPRRGILSNSSSEYATTDTEEDDDDSWASEDVSEGAVDATGTGTGKHPPTKEEIRLREAALEAQRQRELFVKQPKRSYSNLGRTQSGLLSQLLNPEPNVFPPGHRVGSTHDVTRTTGIPSTLTSGKSSAALPLAAQVTAQAPIVHAATSSNQVGYRPKGRPQGEELEDESDSPDDPDDTIQVSHSLAQQRLAALAAKPSRRRASDNQVPTATQTSAMTATRPILPTVATAPIPLNHPWNLPAPAPPTTPRTTRRQMLATELSESLRRNLLWERQVSKTNLLGNAGRRNGLGGGGGGGSRLVTTMVNGNGNAQAVPSQQQQQHQQEQEQRQQQQLRQGPGSGDGAQESIAERRQRALARNRTWADDFHYTGW